jgi:branched-subunit amino acid aminotransferase/4-amino-4-deoxychorismate lyase
MNEVVEFVSLNGKVIPAGEARIPVNTSGLFYGAGCFETFRADKNRVFKFEEHTERLNRGLHYLGVDQQRFISSDQLRAEITRLLAENKFLNDSVKIRVQVSLAEKSGYSEEKTPELIRFISATMMSPAIQSAHLTVVNTRVVPAVCKPSDLKLCNMLHYRNAWREAIDSGADDALMLTVDGRVAETAIGNLFWKTGSTVYTPSAGCDILPGIMRNSLIEIIQNMNSCSLIEDLFTPDDVKEADFVWMTNSVAEIKPIHRVDEADIPMDEAFLSELKHSYNQYRQGYLS